MPKAQSIGKRLNEARTVAGLSQSEAAKKWGISVRSLQEWEQERCRPRGLYLKKLEAILQKVGV